MHIFDPYYQDLAKEVVWDEHNIPMHKDEKELDDELGE